MQVATVPTVYGIETSGDRKRACPKANLVLQQYLPFTVLKLTAYIICQTSHIVATVPTVYGIETSYHFTIIVWYQLCCNSTYRLRY